MDAPSRLQVPLEPTMPGRVVLAVMLRDALSLVAIGCVLFGWTLGSLAA